MALKLSTELPTGVVADYWRISEVFILPKQWARISLELYLSQAERESGKSPIVTKQFEFLIPENGDFLTKDLFTVGYTLIKSNPDMSRASDTNDVYPS